MFKQSGNDKLIVGYDIGEENVQISYYTAELNKVETLSMVAGEEAYNIPMVLCKREGVNQWFLGKDAIKYASAEQGTLVDGLLKLAMDKEPVMVEGEEFDPVALLTLFFKRSLGLLSTVGNVDKIAAIMFTCEKLDRPLITLLSTVAANLKMKTEQIFFQSHTESFYYFMLNQPEELWLTKAFLFEYRGDNMKIYRMECNKQTTPIVAYIDDGDFPFASYEPMPEEEKMRVDKCKRLDDEFLKLAQNICQGNLISSVYLIGDYFTDEWMTQSIRYLCKGQRVFKGNNLYSKGACFGALERLKATKQGQEHVFLGNDKLTSNIGMKVLRRGEESYIALLDAGVNWYEADCVQELFLREGDSIELIATSLIGKGTKTLCMTLEEFANPVARLLVHLSLSRENCLKIEVEDLGFGEFFEATHKVWVQEAEI